MHALGRSCHVHEAHCHAKVIIVRRVQLVLEVLERNVRQGSNVYETGHILVLGWVDNRSDEEVMWKILSQVPHIGTAGKF